MDKKVFLGLAIIIITLSGCRPTLEIEQTIDYNLYSNGQYGLRTYVKYKKGLNHGSKTMHLEFSLCQLDKLDSIKNKHFVRARLVRRRLLDVLDLKAY